MKGNVIEMNTESYVVAARQLLDRGEISIEQYAVILRRAAGGKGK